MDVGGHVADHVALAKLAREAVERLVGVAPGLERAVALEEGQEPLVEAPVLAGRRVRVEPEARERALERFRAEAARVPDLPFLAGHPP